VIVTRPRPRWPVVAVFVLMGALLVVTSARGRVVIGAHELICPRCSGYASQWNRVFVRFASSSSR